ncbi:hypothetical protein L195_g040349, partial [Trifolium pratense]
RYCLDGPVIFTDEVIWFCVDCEEAVIDTDYPDQVTSDSEKGEVDCSDRCVTVVDPQPIADPTWRGSLQVCHKSDDKITRLMAHLSTLACPKVLEETRHLPNVLYGNLLQRSAVWPASFTKFGTNNLSIGLYLFPQNESAERYYDQLVDEIISNDLAISAQFEKSELLIFASTMLPSQYKSRYKNCSDVPKAQRLGSGKCYRIDSQLQNVVCAVFLSSIVVVVVSHNALSGSLGSEASYASRALDLLVALARDPIAGA